MRKEYFSFPAFFATNPVISMVCLVFLIADIVLLDHILMDRKHLKETIRSERLVNELKTVNRELNAKVNALDTKYGKLEAANRELEKQNRDAQAEANSKISALTANLTSCQDANLRFIQKIKDSDSESASLKNDLDSREKRLEALKSLFDRQIALEPTWIRAGEGSRSFGDDLAVAVDEPNDKTGCPEDSPAVARLVAAGGEKKDLCLAMNRPQAFSYKGRKLLVHLMGVTEDEPPHGYLVSIVKDREKTAAETHEARSAANDAKKP